MGQFSVKIILRGETGIKEIPLLVDTGATYSHITQEDAREVGVLRSKTIKAEVSSGKNQKKELSPMGLAAFTLGKRTGGVTVVIDGDRLLGAQALEVLGYRVDSVERKLIPIEGFVVRV